jgi:hypothetical protein
MMPVVAGRAKRGRPDTSSHALAHRVYGVLAPRQGRSLRERRKRFARKSSLRPVMTPFHFRSWQRRRPVVCGVRQARSCARCNRESITRVDFPVARHTNAPPQSQRRTSRCRPAMPQCNGQTIAFFAPFNRRGNRVCCQFNWFSGIGSDFVRQWDSLTIQGRDDRAFQIGLRVDATELCAFDERIEKRSDLGPAT